MNKVTVFSVFAFAASMAFAETATTAKTETPKKWTHFAGAGVTVPVTHYEIDRTKTDLVNVGMNLSYTGVARNGFTAKAAVSSGASVTDDVKFVGSDDDWQVGSFVIGELGMGYTFGRPDKFTLSVLAVVGFEVDDFESSAKDYKHEDLGKVDRSYQTAFGAFTVGGDLVARMAVSKHVGVFASAGARWNAVAVTLASTKYEKDDFKRVDTETSDDRGTYSVVPTVGAMWAF